MTATRQLPFEERLPVSFIFGQGDELQYFDLREGEGAYVDLIATEMPASPSRLIAVVGQAGYWEAPFLHKLVGTVFRQPRRGYHLAPEDNEWQISRRNLRSLPARRHDPQR